MFFYQHGYSGNDQGHQLSTLKSIIENDYVSDGDYEDKDMENRYIIGL